jgi:HEPN domain-containing protein
MSDDADVWMRQSQNDLEAARCLSATNHHSQAIWCASQAVEKRFKAVLVSLGLNYQDEQFKRHFGHRASEVLKLLPDALQEPRDPVVASKLETLEKLGAKSRYPLLSQSPQQPGSWVAPADSFTTSGQEISDAEYLLLWADARIARARLAVIAMKPPPTN